MAHSASLFTGEAPPRETAWVAWGSGLLLAGLLSSLMLWAVLERDIAWLGYAPLAVYAIPGAVLLALGVRRVHLQPPEAFEPVAGYSLTIAALGALLLLFAASTFWSALAVNRVLVAVSLGFELPLGIAALGVVLLRARRSRLAPCATATFAILSAPFLPFGTAAFVWWLVSVRELERGGPPAL